ncbi:MAG: hypothetical protein ABR991_00695 [Terracidiphilus sp.]|jgi:hypothetical protein
MNYKSLPIFLLAYCCAMPCLADHLEPEANHSAFPLPVVDIEDSSHMVVAQLFVDPGETMQLDSDQHPAAGAGYYQAMPGQDHVLLIPAKLQLPRLGAENCLCALHMDKIGWNRQGVVTTVAGLRPYLETALGVKIPIVSDVKHPRIADGKVFFKLKGHGASEYWVLTRYGQVVEVGGPWGFGELVRFLLLDVLPIIVIALLAISIAGAIRLHREDTHPDKSFLELMQMALMSLPLLRKLHGERESKQESEE